VEIGFAPNWSVAFEYDHLFMGSRDLSFTFPATTLGTRADTIRQDVDMGTVRVDYRFGGPWSRNTDSPDPKGLSSR